MSGLRTRFGSISNSCVASVTWSANQVDPTIPPSSCNPKYVYDGSDYIEFRKKQAMNRNYNDRSFGGNDSNASQSAMRAIKRY